jgi:hypothetical protein
MFFNMMGIKLAAMEISSNTEHLFRNDVYSTYEETSKMIYTEKNKPYLHATSVLQCLPSTLLSQAKSLSFSLFPYLFLRLICSVRLRNITLKLSIFLILWSKRSCTHYSIPILNKGALKRCVIWRSIEWKKNSIFLSNDANMWECGHANV